MLIMDSYKIAILWILGTVFMLLAVSVATSLLRPAGGARKGGDTR